MANSYEFWRSIAVTFDDGPDPSTTPKLLKVLDQLEIKATMFVIGQKCRGNKELLKEVAAAGHTLACHGYSHERHWFRDASFVLGSHSSDYAHLLDEFRNAYVCRYFVRPLASIDFSLHKRVTSSWLLFLFCGRHIWVIGRPQSDAASPAKTVSVVHDRMILLLHDGHDSSRKC